MSQTNERPKVLIVDDTPANLKILAAALRDDYQVFVATSGEQGLMAAIRERPDLILLDVVMPGQSGLDVCRALKADSLLCGIPVIFLTGKTSEEDEAEGFAAGGSDYVTKPFSPGLVAARVRLHIALKRANDKLAVANVLMSEEIRQVAALQDKLLPKEEIQIRGLSMSSLYRPSGKASGDYFDYFRVGENVVRLIIADVSGHGSRAAFVMAIVRTLFRLSITDPRPLPEVMRMINTHLLDILGDEDDFVTAFAADFTTAAGKLEYVNAGHCPGVLADGWGNVEILESTATVLGFFDEAFISRTLDVGNAFSLLLYTDGLFQWRLPGGTPFTQEGFVEIARNLIGQESFSLPVLEGELAELAQGEPPVQDDVTALLLSFKAPHIEEYIEQGPGRSRLLLVDDAPSQLAILVAALEEDYDLTLANDGESALELVQRERPDLVLLDVMMPGLSGHDVCRALKENQATKGTPVIFMTAMTEEEDEIKGLELGAVDYIQKPLSIPIVKARLKTHLELKRKSDRLEELASVDALTGIPNRRAFQDYLDKEWRLATRNGKFISLILMDIDYFKRYNDTYGHAAGDDCLRKVAQVLPQSLRRAADFVARYGGEEFVVILPDTDLAGALEVAGNIRARVESLGIEHQASDAAPTVTVSLGAACLSPNRNTLPDSLILQADKNLYRAKERGRNRVAG